MRNEKMKNRFIRHVLILLLCGLCHTAAYAVGYDRSTQSGSWGYQPVYNTRSAVPKYQFYSTSAYILPSGTYHPAYSTVSKPRRTSPFDFDPSTDDPLGTVPDPLPIGDTPWIFMFLLATGYIAFRYLHHRKKETFDEANPKP